MKVELIVALVGLGGIIIGAVIGARVSVWITKQQLSLSYKQNKIEILQGQITRLQNGLDKMSGISIDVKDSNLLPEQLHSRSIDAFLERSKFFLTFSYLFPKELEEEVMGLSDELNQFIYHAKIQQPIDEDAALRTVGRMPVIEKEMLHLFRTRLRVLQSELDKITITLE